MMTRSRMKTECLANWENKKAVQEGLRIFLFDKGLEEEEIAEINMVVSEAIDNIIVHAYPKVEGVFRLETAFVENGIQITLEDDGVGIEDVMKAKEPFFTTKSELERSGMGFSIMAELMNEVNVISQPGKGTRVEMFQKCIGEKG